MKEIHFPNWDAVLANAKLPERLRKTFQITIRWYLNFCRRSRAGVNHESARAFIEWAQQEKQPEAWQVEQWKEAIRWFPPTTNHQRRRLYPVAVKWPLRGVNAAVDADGLIAGDSVDEIERGGVRRDRAPGGQVG